MPLASCDLVNGIWTSCAFAPRATMAIVLAMRTPSARAVREGRMGSKGTNRSRGAALAAFLAVRVEDAATEAGALCAGGLLALAAVCGRPQAPAGRVRSAGVQGCAGR